MVVKQMSEKRFVIDEKTNYKDYPIILDTKTGDRWVIQDTMMGTGKLLDLLNELNELNEELNKQVNNYHATFQSLLKTNLSLNNQLAETQKELKELYESLFPKPDLEHLNCRCSYEPIE